MLSLLRRRGNGVQKIAEKTHHLRPDASVDDPLQVSSVLINYTLWPSNLFSAFSCFPRFSWFKFFRIQVRVQGLEIAPSGVFYKKAVLKHFAIFTGKHLCWSLFLINFINKDTPIQVFSCEYYEIIKYNYLKNFC